MIPRHRFISLGGDCQPAHHIKRVTGCMTLMFFDWLTTPIIPVASLITSRFADAFSPDTLIWEPIEDAGDGVLWHVTDRRYGMMAPHHFHGDDPSYVQTVIKILHRLGENLLDAMNVPEPVIFVRRQSQDNRESLTITIEALQPLMTIKPNCVLLYLQELEDVAPMIERNVIICYNPHTDITGWEGDSALYDRHFTIADDLATRLYGLH